MTSETDPAMQKAVPQYEIRLKGTLSDEWTEWFNGMVMSRNEEGNTTLTGPVADQSMLYGLLDRAHDFGLPLLSVKLLDE